MTLSIFVKVKVIHSCLTLCNPMDCASVEFFRPEYWSGYPVPSSGDLPNPGVELRSPTLQADSLPAEPQAGKESKMVNSNYILSLLSELLDRLIIDRS